MTEKERQAKLQYLLNSLSMTKEQRDIVVDLVNSSGNGGASGGGGNNETHIMTLYLTNNKVIFDNVEYDVVIVPGSIIDIKNKELYKVMLDHSESNSSIDVIMIDEDVIINSKVISRHKNPMTGAAEFSVVALNVISQFSFIEE